MVTNFYQRTTNKNSKKTENTTNGIIAFNKKICLT